MSWVRHACRVGASAIVLGALAAPLSADTYYFRYRPSVLGCLSACATSAGPRLAPAI